MLELVAAAAGRDRADRSRFVALLADDFVEIGASGWCGTKQSILELLAEKVRTTASSRSTISPDGYWIAGRSGAVTSRRSYVEPAQDRRSGDAPPMDGNWHHQGTPVVRRSAGSDGVEGTRDAEWISASPVVGSGSHDDEFVATSSCLLSVTFPEVVDGVDVVAGRFGGRRRCHPRWRCRGGRPGISRTLPGVDDGYLRR